MCDRGGGWRRVAGLAVIALACLFRTSGPIRAESIPVRIEPQDGGGFRLLRGGEPTFIKGAVVGRLPMDSVAAAGGNSVRCGLAQMDRAHALGLSALANINLGKPRDGFDYDDPAAVAEQAARVREEVLASRDHPAVLMWALGNELEIRTTAEQRASYLKAINALARMIHEVDPDHPVMTVMGGQFVEWLGDVKKYCPDLDLIGLNAYGTMLKLPEAVKQHGWNRPYVVTEFGPRGHWESPRTMWGLPIEQTSTEKAAYYEAAYRHAVADQPLCLGSYVFYWSQKQEKTHTWYGMLIEDGRRTESVDAMQRLWTGQWPSHRCPSIVGGAESIRLALTDPLPGLGTISAGAIPPGCTVAASIQASDPEGDPLQYTWDLRRDVADNPNVGGDYEPPTKAIEDALTGPDLNSNQVLFQMPNEPGNYRIFVVVSDGHGAATANLPVRVARQE